MRKNFLILMLMALLPLAGWAEGFDNASVKFGKFTYGDTSIPAEQVTDEILLTKGTHYTVDTKIYKENTFETEVTCAQMLAGHTYYVKIFGKEGSVYEGYETYGEINVKKAKLTLKVNDGTDLTKAYRAADPAASGLTVDFNDTGELKNSDGSKTFAQLVSGTLSYSYANQPNANAANDIELTFSGLTADNYEIEYAALNIDITAKDLSTVTIVAQQGDVTYTGSNITPVYTLKDGDYTLVAGADKDYTVSTSATPVHDVATYTPTITGSNNYTGTITTTGEKVINTFDVTKATLSVAAKSQTETYNATNYTISSWTNDVVFYGLLGADVDKTSSSLEDYTAPTFTLTGTNAKNAGDYIITLTGGSSKNYEFLLQNTGTLAGKLTIEPAELTVTADNKTKGIGEANPTLTYSITGYKGGEKKADAIQTEPTLATTATASSAAGTYPITISGGATKSNYKFKYVDGTLTVGKVAITLTLLPAKKTYGDDDPDFLGATGTPVEDVNYVVNGLMEGDELSNIHITRAAGQNVGKYVMSATYDAVDLDKYTGVSVAPAQFTIEARPLTVTLLPQTLANDADQTALVVSDATVETEDLQYDDEIDDVIALAFATSVSGTTDVDYAAGIVASLKSGVTNYSLPTTAPTGRLIFGAGGATLTLSDADATNPETIGLYGGKTVNVTINLAGHNGRKYATTDTESYSWKADKWTTMVLPFDISVKDLSAKLGYAVVNVIDATRTTVSGTESKFYGKLTMKGGNGNATKLAANKPFLVKIAEDFTTTTVDFGSQTIVAPTDLSVNAGEGAKFVGTYTTKTVTGDDDAAFWFMNGDEDGWQYINSGSSATWSIVPYEAYIDMSASSAPRNIIFYVEDIDGTVTAINGINAESATGAAKVAEGWYTINGVKLQAAPTQKGIYILNGKKYVVK